MNRHGGAYMDVTPLTGFQTDQPVYVCDDDKPYYGYGYRIEIIGDLFVLRLEDVTAQRQRGGPEQRADRRMRNKANHWHPGETRRH
jgi:hypothetical protein